LGLVSVILLLDDNAAVRMVMRKVLARGGHEVIECASASEALGALSRSRPEVLITELCMPQTDGVKLIQSVRELHAGLPVVAITGGGRHLPRALLLDEAKRAGADQVLSKPVGMRELLSAVRDAVEGEISGAPLDRSNCDAASDRQASQSA
jgi:DNA-binding NtrC family response regulator